jgi:hypothetical protein
VQLLPLESLDGGVKASGGRRLDERDSLHQLSLHGDDDIQALKVQVRTQVQSMLWLAIRSLLKATKRTKVPYLVHQLSAFRITG